MKRMATVGVAVAGFAAVGCLDEMASRSASSSIGKPIETPKVAEASLASAARVDQVGRELLAANPFLGIEPTFHTVGLPEPAILHPDLAGVIVSEGLVARCKTDAELAAVLASELGQMSAEKRLLERVRGAEPPVGPPTASGGNLTAGGIDSDQSRLAELAIFEKKQQQKRASAGSIATDGRGMAIDILRASGHSEKDLEGVAQLLSEAARNRSLVGGLTRKPDPPRWSP